MGEDDRGADPDVIVGQLIELIGRTSSTSPPGEQPGVSGHTAIAVQGYPAVNAAYNDMQAVAVHRVDAFDCGPHSPESTGQSDAQSAALERGVQYRVVYGPGVFPHEPLLDTMLLSVRQGERARYSRIVPARLLLRDDSEFMLLHTAAEGRAVAAVRGTDPWIVDFLCRTFTAIWESALPLDHARLGRRKVLSGEERELLTLLAAGLTDEAVARRLGVSMRTVQRKVQSLQRSVGAVSRFQLGALAFRAES